MIDEERIEIIQKQLQQIDELKLVLETASSEKFVRWREATKRQLKRVFGEESEQFKTFNSIYYTPWSATTNEVRQRQIERDTFLRGLNGTKIKLQVMIDELNERIQEEEINLTKKAVSKAVSDKNKQLEIEVLEIRLNGLLTKLKTKTVNLNDRREREAYFGIEGPPLSMVNEIRTLESEIKELEAEIHEVKMRLAELGKWLSKN